jgi:hypothetical protein
MQLLLQLAQVLLENSPAIGVLVVLDHEPHPHEQGFLLK